MWHATLSQLLQLPDSLIQGHMAGGSSGLGKELGKWAGCCSISACILQKALHLVVGIAACRCHCQAMLLRVLLMSYCCRIPDSQNSNQTQPRVLARRA